jgi:excisionase family DNA binding protein
VPFPSGRAAVGATFAATNDAPRAKPDGNPAPAQKFLGRFAHLVVYIRMQATTTSEAPLQQDRLLRPDQAAWYLNVKTSWVYEAVRTGRLPCHRVGRHIRFTRLMLDEWLAQQSPGVNGCVTPAARRDR